MWRPEYLEEEAEEEEEIETDDEEEVRTEKNEKEEKICHTTEDIAYHSVQHLPLPEKGGNDESTVNLHTNSDIAIRHSITNKQLLLTFKPFHHSNVDKFDTFLHNPAFFGFPMTKVCSIISMFHSLFFLFLYFFRESFVCFYNLYLLLMIKLSLIPLTHVSSIIAHSEYQMMPSHLISTVSEITKSA